MAAGTSAHLREILRTKGLVELPGPVRLASGGSSRYFVDAKTALADGDDLRLAAETIIGRVAAADIAFDTVGGLTLGADTLAADTLAAAIAMQSRTSWFIVRKEQKGRGAGRLIEGRRLGAGDRVLLIDDVITTGGSILWAYDAVRAAGVDIVAAVTLVDRGHEARQAFRRLGVPYFPMATHHDIGIPAVGTETGAPSARQ